LIDLTVVIASFETRSLLLSCLESVEAARLAHPEVSVETIVVDNGSRDGSARAVMERFPAARVFASVRNRGFAAAMNLGLRARRGRMVLLLNSDVEVGRDLLADAIQILDDDPDIAVLGGALRHADGRAQRSVHPLPGLQTELLPDFLIRLIRPAGSWRPATTGRNNGGGSRPRRVEAVRGAVFFVRGKVLEELGLLDEGFFFFLEETEFCARVRKAGHHVAYAENLKAIHHLGASSKRRSPLATRIEFHRSLYRYLEIERGRTVARLARGIRTARGAVLILGMAIVYGFSSNARRRLPERWGLFLWHLRGCPGEPGLRESLEAVAVGPGGP
jgi:GT2 family glycosyltransferase